MNGNAMHPCGCACGVCMGMSLEDALARQGGEDSGDELVIDRLRAEVRRLEAEKAETLAQVEVLAREYQVACRERDALAEMLREVCALI